MTKSFSKVFLVLLLLINNEPALSKWRTSTAKSQGLDHKTIELLFKYLFDKKEKFSTDSAILIRNGSIIKEQYANGYTKKDTHRTWSISKSVTNTLIGVAVKKGILSLDSKVKKYFPQLDGKDHETMTVDHLLKMSSGIDWREHYEDNPFASDVVRMLYIYDYKDMAGYTAKRPVIHSPGTKFYYSSGESNLIMGILKKSMGLKDYENFPWKELFDKLNIKSATWERDGKNVFVGSSYLFLSPRDLAKIGLLYLNNGKWKNEQILPTDWVTYTTTANSAWHNTQKESKKRKLAYGSHWWLNVGNKHGPYHTSAPENIYMALGHHGQILAVFPNQNIIFVRMGADKKAKIDRNKIFKYIMDGIKQ
jgi:CubicO group peptidase (beta-lactamase class C family)